MLVENRHLIVVKRVSSYIGSRIKLQQSLRLRTYRNDVARERQPRCRIEYDDGLADRVDEACEIARPFRRSGYERGLSFGDVVARPLVGNKKIGPVRQQMRNLESALRA